MAFNPFSHLTARVRLRISLICLAVLGLNLVVGVWWLPFLVIVAMLLNLAASLREMRQSERHIVAHARSLLKLTLDKHPQAGDGSVTYCPSCPGAPAWPCAQYLTALTVSSLSDRQLKREVLKGNLAFTFVIGPED